MKCAFYLRAVLSVYIISRLYICDCMLQHLSIFVTKIIDKESLRYLGALRELFPRFVRISLFYGPVFFYLLVFYIPLIKMPFIYYCHILLDTRWAYEHSINSILLFAQQRIYFLAL